MDFDAVFNIVISAGMGVIVFFLKYFFDKLNSRASRAELNELKEKIEHADDKYASKSELDELKKQIDKIETNIDFLKENTVRNGDFVRMMTRLENKIDDLKKE
ncbi:MAG: aminoacyltransferase [Ruminococcaceae bacterium]|nr:aminoacyltransferase [Oscillospiraceae bacterium]